ncbi:MAG: O-antigen ligase family protein, partial [Algisphaera sp.]
PLAESHAPVVATVLPHTAPPQVAITAGSRWFKLLCFVLAGLAISGRTFAYMGLPPLFISELCVLIGLGVFLLLPGATAALTRPTSLLILALLGLAAIRTLPYLGEYQLDAVRDSVLAGYGVVAIVLAAVLLGQPELLPALLRRFRTFAKIFLCVMPFVWLTGMVGGDALPKLPWASDVSIVELKPGDMPVHLGAIAALTVLGLSRLKAWYFTVLLCVLVAVSGAISRGGLVAFLLMFSIAFWARPRSHWAGRLIIIVFTLISLAALSNLEIKVPGRERSFSAQQIVTNLVSVVSDDATAGDLDDTKEWRLQWWKSIVDYTFFGEYFWQGKGFGINLANSDGFQVELENDGLRSPHNGHLTYLARMGVPGFALWIAVQVVWLYAIANGYYRARQKNDGAWAMFFIFLFAYWAGLMFNAAFDVYFEGPMGGLWIWSVIGVGMAAARLYETHPHLLRGPEFAISE